MPPSGVSPSLPLQHGTKLQTALKFSCVSRSNLVHRSIISRLSWGQNKLEILQCHMNQKNTNHAAIQLRVLVQSIEFQHWRIISRRSWGHKKQTIMQCTMNQKIHAALKFSCVSWSNLCISALANDFAPELRPQKVDNDAPIVQSNVNQKMIQHICRSSGAEQPERAPRLLLRNLASLRPSRYDMEQKYKPDCSSVACFGLIWCSNAWFRADSSQ